MNRQPRYTVRHSDTTNIVYILDKRTGTTHRHDVREFIYGQSFYNEQTNNYPQYVHNAVWENR